MADRPTETPSKVWEVSAEFELRFEVHEKSSAIVIVLQEGSAEVFGTELVQNKEVTLYPGAKVALYTWHGCKVMVNGEPENCYLAKETPMRRYLNVHTALEQQRQQAKATDTAGPRVMVVGLTDVGKSTLCRLLLNYASRLGNQAIFVDLDVGQTSVGVPGSVGVLPVERPADISTGFSQRAPLLFHFGHASPDGNQKLYCQVMDRAAAMVEKRCQALPDAKYGGVVINTCGWVSGSGYKFLRHAAAAFRVNVIIVLDNDLLYNKLQRDGPAIPDFPFQLVALPKSGGVVVRSQRVRGQSRNSRIHSYFYGSARELYPHSFDVHFDSVKIFKIGVPLVPDSCLPVGMKQEDLATQLRPVKPDESLLHCILSVSFTNVEEELLQTHVCGFICVCEVNTGRRSMRVLSPQPEPLPFSLLLLSDVRFMDNG